MLFAGTFEQEGPGCRRPTLHAGADRARWKSYAAACLAAAALQPVALSAEAPIVCGTIYHYDHPE
jgi:hypothetical protein